MWSTSKFLSRSHMIIPFSGNCHVSDSIDWCSFSCSSLVAPRTAKRRRTEDNTRRGGWLAESAGRLSFRLIPVAIIREESILVPSVDSWPCCRVPPRTPRSAWASSVLGNYWKSCFATRRRRPLWFSPFKSLVLTSLVPATLKRLSPFKKVLLAFSCHTPQVKPTHSNGQIARAFLCWTAVP